MNQRLQDLCRSLQASNTLLRQQLEKRHSFEEAEDTQITTMQQALQSITDRSVLGFDFMILQSCVQIGCKQEVRAEQ